MSVSYGLPSGSKTAPTLYIGTGNGGSTTPSYGYVGKGAGASSTFLAPAQSSPSSPPSPPSPPPLGWGVQASLSGPTTVKAGQSITLTVTYNIVTLNNGGTPPQYPMAFTAGGGSSPYFHGDFSNTSVSSNSSSASASVIVYGDKVGSGVFSFTPTAKDASGASNTGGNAGPNINVTT